jgi:hypothetical protein
VLPAAGALACRTTASAFFGVPWKSAFAMYSTENGWKKHGGVSKINLYYNKESGCLTGLKITYGNQVNAVLHTLLLSAFPRRLLQPA